MEPPPPPPLLHLNFASLRLHNASTFDPSHVYSEGFTYSSQGNVDSPTESMSPTVVSPSDTLVSGSNYYDNPGFITYGADTGHALTKYPKPVHENTYMRMRAFISSDETHPFMTSPMETSPYENLSQNEHSHSLYTPERGTAPELIVTGEVITIDELPSHSLVELNKLPNEFKIQTFIKVVGDESHKWYQCGFRGCDTPGTLYKTGEEITKHIEKEIQTYPYACSWRVKFTKWL
ncbi:hypothetical protein Clacol_001849 [Clathrus columnatus]|uniref:Uncharacterized protein n=1 Tax=Clathrus columnatus TaxID=1419009 RepID=A0AAV5A6V8_9AGAM|nr:hypothetical protein Clacol_001849 [Clathrus columnatus]